MKTEGVKILAETDGLYQEQVLVFDEMERLRLAR